MAIVELRYTPQIAQAALSAVQAQLDYEHLTAVTGDHGALVPVYNKWRRACQEVIKLSNEPIRVEDSAKRPSLHETMMQVAVTLSKRATCARRRVGCVIVDDKGQILSTGYNGNGRGLPHCIDKPCAGAAFEMGAGLDKCEAIHAEQNALLQCHDVNKIFSCYTTTMPCSHCTKLLLNTSCLNVYYLDEYPSSLFNQLWTRRKEQLILS